MICGQAAVVLNSMNLHLTHTFKKYGRYLKKFSDSCRQKDINFVTFTFFLFVKFTYC